MTFAGEFLGLPGLRGYWPMNAFDGSGSVIDQSGNARTLTYNGNPTFNVTTQGGPYCDYDGTGDYHSRPDEAGLDILGTESYVATAQRGLTMGGYFWLDANAGASGAGLMSKLTTTQYSYAILQGASGNNSIAGYISTTGTTLVAVGGDDPGLSAWFFAAVRFVPSTSLDVWVNATKTTNTTSIPASLFNSTAAFEIGRAGAIAPVVNGRAGLCFLCAMALSDTAIDNIYQNTKASYGL